MSVRIELSNCLSLRAPSRLACSCLNYSRVLETMYGSRVQRAYKPLPFTAVLAIILRCLRHNEGEFFSRLSLAEHTRRDPLSTRRQSQFSRCSLRNGHHGTPPLTRHVTVRSLGLFFFPSGPRFPRHRGVIVAKRSPSVSVTGRVSRAFLRFRSNKRTYARVRTDVSSSSELSPRGKAS